TRRSSSTVPGGGTTAFAMGRTTSSTESASVLTWKRSCIADAQCTRCSSCALTNWASPTRSTSSGIHSDTSAYGSVTRHSGPTDGEPEEPLSPARKVEQVHAVRRPGVGESTPERLEVDGHGGRATVWGHHALIQTHEVVAAHGDPFALRADGSAKVGHVVDAVHRRIRRAVIRQVDASDPALRDLFAQRDRPLSPIHVRVVDEAIAAAGPARWPVVEREEPGRAEHGLQRQEGAEPHRHATHPRG